MIKNIAILYFVFLLNACLWPFIPPYSPFWDEETWFHKDDKSSLTRDIFIDCRNKSLAPFETKVVGGLKMPVNPDDWVKYDDLYGACLYQKGFRFSASYKHCYKYRNLCKIYKKYSK
ncbi:hypothetical protein ACLSY0_04105 [Avibacterium avium]|uniref:hypothetical protein n=1 Tax=Avibacterium avium TaxID=751 RepID=UPI003BF7BD56